MMVTPQTYPFTSLITARARTYNIDYIQMEANAEGNTFRFSSNILRYPAASEE